MTCAGTGSVTARNARDAHESDPTIAGDRPSSMSGGATKREQDVLQHVHAVEVVVGDRVDRRLEREPHREQAGKEIERVLALARRPRRGPATRGRRRERRAPRRP